MEMVKGALFPGVDTHTHNARDTTAERKLHVAGGTEVAERVRNAPCVRGGKRVDSPPLLSLNGSKPRRLRSSDMLGVV